MTRRETLRWRLVATSAAWVVATLLVSAVALVLFFRDHIERRFDDSLGDHLEELVAASEIGAGGALVLSWRPFDPRFNRPRSGWYWQVRQGEHTVTRSDSLAGTEMPAGGAPVGPSVVRELKGPSGEALRAVEQSITLPRSTSTFVYTVAGPIADVNADVAHFTRQIAVTMILLAAGLLVTVFLQVRFGLRPLEAMRAALSAVRAGESERLEGEFPEEVRPLAEELNALLERNAAMLDRARAHAADLAHALKNPLTVIKNEASSMEGPGGDAMRKEVAAMREAIDRHLSRARAAGGQARPGQRTAINDVVDDLRYSLERVYRDRNLIIETGDLESRTFLGEREDLEEMLGNVMDNACKWAKRRVVVETVSRDGRLVITVDDDGSGLPPEQAEQVLSRGTRLDESTPGTGMGLAIVRDLAEGYGGSISLSDSPLGGLRVTLNIPRAE